MRRTIIVLISLFALCAGAAQAQLVTNNTSSFRMSDSVCVILNSLDSLGQWSTQDSIYAIIRAPRGVSFRDSGTIAGMTGMQSTTLGGRTIYSWRRQVSDLDSNWGAGRYNGLIYVVKTAQPAYPTTKFFEMNVMDTLSTNGVGMAISQSVWNANYYDQTKRHVNAKYWRGIIVPFFTGSGADTLIPVKVVVNAATTVSAADRDNIRASVLNAKYATVDASATSSTFTSTSLTQATDYWTNCILMALNGVNINQSRVIKRSALYSGKDSIVVASAFLSAFGTGDSVMLVPSGMYNAAAKAILDSTMSGLALADSVWTRDTTSWISGKAGSTTGKLISKAATSATATISNAAMAAIGDSVVNKQIIKALTRAVVVKQGSCSGTPTTTKFASSNLSEADNYWNDNMVVMISGSAIGQAARITGMYNTGDSITFAPAFSVAPAAADSFVILGVISEAGAAADSVTVYKGATGAIIANTASIGMLRDSLIFKYSGIKLIVTGSGATTTSIPTDLTESATDYWKDALAVYIDGGLVGQTRRVTAYNGTTKALTVDAFTGSPVQYDTLILIPAGSGGTASASLSNAQMGAIADSVAQKNVSAFSNFGYLGTRVRLAGDSTQYATPADVWKQKADSSWLTGSMGEAARLRWVAGFAMSIKPAGVFGNYLTDPLFLSYDTSSSFTGGSGPWVVSTYGTTGVTLNYDLPETYKSISVGLLGGSGKDSINISGRRAIQVNPGVYQFGFCVRRQSGVLTPDSIVCRLTDSTSGSPTLIDSFVYIVTPAHSRYREYTKKVTVTTARRLNVDIHIVGTGGAVARFAYLLLRGGGGADPSAIAAAVWNADTATYNDVAASYGLVLANPAYVQGAAAGVSDSSIVAAIRTQMNPATTGSNTIGHYLAQRSDSGASTASIAAGVWAYATRSLTDKDNFTLSTTGNNSVGLATWNTSFGSAFTFGSMGDSLTNPSYVGNIYTIANSTDIVSGASREAGRLRDIFRSTGRAPVYLSKLDVVGDNGTDGSVRIVNSGGPGMTVAASSDNVGISISAPGTSGVGIKSVGGAYGMWGEGNTAGWYGYSQDGSAWRGLSVGNQTTFDMHNAGFLGGWAGSFNSDNGGGLYTFGTTYGILTQGISQAGLKSLGLRGIQATSTSGGVGIHGVLDSVNASPVGSGGGSDTVAIKQLAANNPSYFFGPTSAGTGSAIVRIYAIDTSASPDQRVQQTKLTVQNTSGVSSGVAYTLVDGYFEFSLDPGTYNVVATHPPYTFPVKSITIVGNTDSVAVQGYISTAFRAGHVSAYVDIGSGMIDSLTGTYTTRPNVTYTLNLVSPGGTLIDSNMAIIPTSYTKVADSVGRVMFFVPANTVLTPKGSYYSLRALASDGLASTVYDLRPRFILDTSSNPINIMTARAR